MFKWPEMYMYPIKTSVHTKESICAYKSMFYVVV